MQNDNISQAQQDQLHWRSKTPVCYKRNAIIGDLNRAKRKSTKFEEELKIIRKKFVTAGFPSKFVDSIIRNFNKPKTFEFGKDLFFIPKLFFE